MSDQTLKDKPDGECPECGFYSSSLVVVHRADCSLNPNNHVPKDKPALPTDSESAAQPLRGSEAREFDRDLVRELAHHYAASIIASDKYNLKYPEATLRLGYLDGRETQFNQDKAALTDLQADHLALKTKLAEKDTELDQAHEEIARLERWKMEMDAVARPIFEFEHPEMKLGESRVAFLIRMAHERDEALERVQITSDTNKLKQMTIHELQEQRDSIQQQLACVLVNNGKLEFERDIAVRAADEYSQLIGGQLMSQAQVNKVLSDEILIYIKDRDTCLAECERLEWALRAVKNNGAKARDAKWDIINETLERHDRWLKERG